MTSSYGLDFITLKGNISAILPPALQCPFEQTQYYLANRFPCLHMVIQKKYWNVVPLPEQYKKLYEVAVSIFTCNHGRSISCLQRS